jgi:hypothetical protein
MRFMFALTAMMFSLTLPLPVQAQTVASKTIAKSSSNTCFNGPIPWFDPTCYGASGSSQSTTGNCTRGSTTVPLSGSGAIDFVNGQGVAIPFCGASPTVTKPSTIRVVPQGTTGSTTYSYSVATFDAGGGNSGYGTLSASTATGNATLSGTNYNAIYFSPAAGARAYALIGRANGSPTLLQYLPWEESTTSYTGAMATRTSNFVIINLGGAGLVFYPLWFVTLTGCSDPTFNGTFQVTNTTGSGGGTFGYSQTSANSTATGCTVTVDPTFFDFGTTFPHPNNTGVGFSATPDIFVSSIASGAGTTTLTLTTAPSRTEAGATVYHDDTAAWKAVIRAAAASTPAPGLNNAAPLHCSNGTYVLSSDLNVSSGFTLEGPGVPWLFPSCQLFQLNPAADIFRAQGAGIKISDVLLTGGRVGIDSVSPRGMQAFFTENVMFQSYIGHRVSANTILTTMRNTLCQTQDWCIDESPAATLQGFKMDTCWFSGVGNGTWHDVRMFNTIGYTSGLVFDNCLWEGPLGNWMVASNTPVGARMILGSIQTMLIRAGQESDSGSTNVSFIQTLPTSNSGLNQLKFEGSYMGGETNGDLINTLGTPIFNLEFDGGSYSAGAGIWTGAAPQGVINHGAFFSPAISGTNLVTEQVGEIGVGTSSPQAALDVSGGIRCALATKSATYTLTTNDCTIEVTGTTTITVPHAKSNQIWHVFNSGSGTVTIEPDSGTINGAASVSRAADTGYDVWCDGTNCFAK